MDDDGAITIETHLQEADANQRVELVAGILAASGEREYYAYERDQCWHVGLGSQSSVLVDSSGKSAVIRDGGGGGGGGDDDEREVPVGSTLDQVARDFVAARARPGLKVFGHVGYNYAAHVRGINYKPGEWPLLNLMVPLYQVTVSRDSIKIQGRDGEGLQALVDAIRSADGQQAHEASGGVESVDLSQTADQYTRAVEETLAKISDGDVTKVIVSRAVAVPERIDMLATLVRGRTSNTPQRAFSFSFSGFQSTGFSPELVLSVEGNGRVTTEPLAGTRACPEDREERERLRRELESDPKEIVEHVISVKEAVSELERICPAETVVVEDLMSVRARGRVQHLGSRVAGVLGEGMDCWHALNVLFPAITASGIPKRAALEVIESLESRPRELYSGGVIMMDPCAGEFEATLVLRSAFQDPRRQWVQAGAGVIAQSRPERELTETCEKLATLVPFLVSEKSGSGGRRR